MSSIVNDIWFQDRLRKALEGMGGGENSTEPPMPDDIHSASNSPMPDDYQNTNASSKSLFNGTIPSLPATPSMNMSNQVTLNRFIQAVTSMSGFNGEEMTGWLFWALVVAIVAAMAAGVIICVLVKKAKKTQMTTRMKLYTEELPLQIIDQFETHTLSALRRIEVLVGDVQQLCLVNHPGPSSPIDTPSLIPRPPPQSPTLPHFPRERLQIIEEDVETAARGNDNAEDEEGDDGIFKIEV